MNRFRKAIMALLGREPAHRPTWADEAFAEELVARLNRLILEDPSRYSVKHALAWLIESRLPCLSDLRTHPTIQIDEDDNGRPVVGFLGILNGLAGVIPDGPREGWGWIAAVRDAEDRLMLLGFEVVDAYDSAPLEGEGEPVVEGSDER